MAMMPQSTLNRPIALAVGPHNFALRQRKKYQYPFEKGGFRPFRNWSSGETNVIQTSTLLFQISLSPSRRPVWSPSLSTVANYRIGHREQEYCLSTTIWGLKKRETKCAHGVRTLANNAFDGFVDPPSQSGQKRPREDPQSHPNEPPHKRPNLRDSSNTAMCNELADSLPQTESIIDLAVNLDLEIRKSVEKVLKIKGFTPSSTDENKVERAKQMAQKAAVLSLYGEMLQEMGRKLLAQSRASLYSIFERPAPPNSDSN